MTIDEIIGRALTGMEAAGGDAQRAGAGMASLEYKTALIAPAVENVGSFASPQLRAAAGFREIQSADSPRRLSGAAQAAEAQRQRDAVVALLTEGRLRFGSERVADFAEAMRESARLIADAKAAVDAQTLICERAAAAHAVASRLPPKPDAGAAPAVATPSIAASNALARPLRMRWEIPLGVGDLRGAEAAAVMVLRSIKPRPDDADKRELVAALERLIEQVAARLAHAQMQRELGARIKAWEQEVAAMREQAGATQRELREVEAVRLRLQAEVDSRTQNFRFRSDLAAQLRRLQPGHFRA